jgi:hypothetical protein
LAERIVRDGESHKWLLDAIPFDCATPPLSEEEMARLRNLRAKVGSALVARGWTLPEAIAVTSASELSKIHYALREYDELGAEVAEGQVPHLASIDNGRALAEELLQLLDTMKGHLQVIEEATWISKYIGDLSAPSTSDKLLSLSVSDVARLFESLIEGEKKFVLNQVQAPPIEGPDLSSYFSKAAQGGRPYSNLPFLRPSEQVIAALESVRVRGAKPQTKEDWSLVAEHHGWRLEVVRIAGMP